MPQRTNSAAGNCEDNMRRTRREEHPSSSIPGPYFHRFNVRILSNRDRIAEMNKGRVTSVGYAGENGLPNSFHADQTR
jgi:hypothetical protein